jgi:hypothetical protein
MDKIMIRLKKHILTNEQADLLIERYYEGLTTGEEENQLRAFLSRTDLPEIYRAEKAMFGYFGAQKSKPAFSMKSYLGWASGAAATIALFVGLNFYTQSVSAGNFAFVDGHKITNTTEVKRQAFASMQELSDGEREIKESLQNVSGADVINQQLNVFAEQ